MTDWTYRVGLFFAHEKPSDWLSSPLEGYGREVPDLDFTSDASTASINPSTFTSSRKLELVTALPDCDFVWLTSMASVNRSAFVSPRKKLTGTLTLPGDETPSVTPFNVTEQFEAFGTPVKLIVTSFPDVLVPLTMPHDVD